LLFDKSQVKLTPALSQKGSGKSSLINAVFKMDMSVCTQSSPDSYPTGLTVPCNTFERLHQGVYLGILPQTPSFVDATAVTLPFMNVPDLDRKTCSLSEISSRPIATRTSRHPKGYTPSGNEALSVVVSCTTDEGELRICVSMSESDFIDGVFGEGGEILGLGGEYAQRIL